MKDEFKKQTYVQVDGASGLNVGQTYYVHYDEWPSVYNPVIFYEHNADFSRWRRRGVLFATKEIYK